jgi:hypothetical protein
MKHFVLLTITAIFCSLSAFSQIPTGVIRGAVKDSSGNAFDAATVVLYNIKDSSVVETIATNSRGEFGFKNVAIGNYKLFLSSVQFSALVKDVQLTNESPSKDFGTIIGKKGYQQDAVTVIAQNPVRIAEDTIEFKADAFKTRPNAVVEDLLKKLPGVQVDKDGTIKAQGQTVTKVFVDGKPFFGDDPKTATKNLPAGIVDKVQVIDKKSDQSQFTGFDDGITEKVINITIKKDKKKGFFGRANVGVGTEGPYESNLSFNRFNNGTQISLIGQANNNNNEGFTFQDMMDFSGNGGFGGGRSGDGSGDGGGGFGGGGGTISMTRGTGGMFGGSSFGGPPTGLRTTQAGGINVSTAFSKKLTLSSSYFYNHGYTFTEQLANSRNFDTDSIRSFINNETSTDKTYRTNHRLNAAMDWAIDSFNSILIRPNLTYVKKENNSATITDIKSLKELPKSSNIQKSKSNTAQLNFSGTLLWRHKTRVKGRTLSVRLNAGANSTDGDGDNVNQQDFFSPSPFSVIRDQINTTDNSSNTLNTRVSYTEPLSKTRILELTYTYGRNENNSDRRTLKRDPFGLYTVLDTFATNVFENTFQSHQLGFNIQTKLKKYDYTVGLSAQKSDLISNNIVKNTSLKQSNVYNLFPTARLNYNFGKNRNLRFNYRGSTNQPSATQLQPIVDSSNVLSIYEGNPALKQEFTNSLNISYNNFNFVSLKTMFLFLNFSNTNNKIVNGLTNNPFGGQNRKPINLNGAYNVIGNFSFGFPVKAIKKTNINSSTSIVYNNDINVLNAIQNTTKTVNVNQTLSVNYTYKDNLDISLSGMAGYNKATNQIQTFNTDPFYTFNTSFDISYNFKNNLTIQSDVENTSYKGRTNGFNQNFTIWNGSISKLLLKDKSLEAKFTAFDILKQNRSIDRSIQNNIIKDVSTNTITQYFMVSLKYSLNKFGGKGAKPFSMPKGVPGMRQMNNMRIGM